MALDERLVQYETFLNEEIKKLSERKLSEVELTRLHTYDVARHKLYQLFPELRPSK